MWLINMLLVVSGQLKIINSPILNIVAQHGKSSSMQIVATLDEDRYTIQKPSRFFWSTVNTCASNPEGTHRSRVRGAFTQGWWVNNQEGHADVSSTPNSSTFGQSWIENPKELDPWVLVSLEICWKFLGHSCQWRYINTETWMNMLGEFKLFHFFRYDYLLEILDMVL